MLQIKELITTLTQNKSINSVVFGLTVSVIKESYYIFTQLLIFKYKLTLGESSQIFVKYL